LVMPDRRIFISCGQLTEQERTLGRRLKTTIDERPGMTGFFANEVHSAAGLNAEIFQAIQTCYAFLAVLHHRGEVRFPGYPDAQRSSVWIQQEIAIFSYRMFLEGTPRPIRVYEQRGILLEGLMRAAVVNPVPFDTDEEVIRDVETWLDGRELEGDPILARREDLFRRRMDGLSDDALLLLELTIAHAVTPTDRVDQLSVIDDFYDSLGVPRGNQEAFERSERARRDLMDRGLLGWAADHARGRPDLWVYRQWWELASDEFRVRSRRV
jgi:hypothetical protein